MEAERFKAFNHAIKTFLRELMTRFPDIPELKLTFAGYKVLKTVNKKSPCTVFMRLITEEGVPFVLKKDDSYFMRPNLDIDPCLRGIAIAATREWSKLEPVSKEAIWQHMSLMCLLAFPEFVPSF
jgi:hypothetical protein